MLRGVCLSRAVAARSLHSSAASRYAAAPDRKVRVRVVSNKKKNGRPSRGPGTHMTFKEMVTKQNLNKDAVELELPVLGTAAAQPGTAYAYANLRELHHLGAFNKNQYNELWSSPFSIARESSTLPLLKFYESGVSGTSDKNRMVLTGENGVGKTTAISQFQSFAKSNNGIVISINDCEKLIDGSNDYVFDHESGLYQQPMLLNTLFNKLKKGNMTEFSNLKLSKQYKIFQYNLNTKNNLVDLINIGKKLKSTQKFHVWTALLEELQAQQTYPVFLTVDNFSAIIKRPYTNYRDTSNQFIYFDKFTFGKFIIDHISGAASFGNGGGAVLVGTTGGRQKKTLSVPLGLAEFDPYAKRTDFDATLATYLAQDGLQHLEIPRFEKQELKLLLDQCLKNDILKNDDVTDPDKVLNGKYILSGNGNPREFYKSCVLNYY